MFNYSLVQGQASVPTCEIGIKLWKAMTGNCDGFIAENSDSA